MHDSVLAKLHGNCFYSAEIGLSSVYTVRFRRIFFNINSLKTISKRKQFLSLSLRTGPLRHTKPVPAGPVPPARPAVCLRLRERLRPAVPTPVFSLTAPTNVGCTARPTAHTATRLPRRDVPAELRASPHDPSHLLSSRDHGKNVQVLCGLPSLPSQPHFRNTLARPPSKQTENPAPSRHLGAPPSHPDPSEGLPAPHGKPTSCPQQGSR